MTISFTALPDIGTVLWLDEQEYELRSIEPHTRKDGAATSLLVWETTCPACRGGFVVKTGLAAKSVNRRCPRCVKPHKPVKGKRGRKVQVGVHHA